MAAPRRPKTKPDHLTCGEASLDDRTFMMPKWAPHIIDELLAATNGVIKATSLKQLGVKLRVPLKPVPRAVASVARLGLVTAELEPPDIRVTIHRERLARREIVVERSGNAFRLQIGNR